MITKEEFWQELSGLLGRELHPETHLEDNPAIWTDLSPEKQDKIRALLDIAMHSPDILFASEPGASLADELVDVELPLWEEVVPANPLSPPNFPNVGVPQPFAIFIPNKQNVVLFSVRQTSSQPFGSVNRKLHGLARL